LQWRDAQAQATPIVEVKHPGVAPLVVVETLNVISGTTQGRERFGRTLAVGRGNLGGGDAEGIGREDEAIVLRGEIQNCAISVALNSRENRAYIGFNGRCSRIAAVQEALELQGKISISGRQNI
jgi:hypothetical protein